MATFRTHYQNLKVAEDAPDFVIRAAYRALTNEFHPDRNVGDPESERISAIINASYAVLSDPEKRRQHDSWIARMRREDIGIRDQPYAPVKDLAPPIVTPSPASTAPARSRGRRARVAILRALSTPSTIGIGGSLAGVLLVALSLVAMNNRTIVVPTATLPGTAPVSGLRYASANKLMPDTSVDVVADADVSTDTVVAPVKFARPQAAPNGMAWPSYATYLRGYSVGARGGLSEVTIDNSRNRSDVFVKLVDVGGSKPYPVRQLFIPSYGSITLHSVLAGLYEIRYRDLASGALVRSEPFTLRETSTDEGIRYSSVTMMLYKVTSGNLKTFALRESEF